MIADVFALLLWPLTYIMDMAFGMFLSVTESVGLSIMLLSTAVALLTYPFRVWAQKVERRVRLRKLSVDERVIAATVGLKGEQKFRATENIYQSHGFHPIQSIALGMPLFVMLPFLLSALFLFSSNVSLEGVGFLFIPDLALPDGLLLGGNLLPVVMTLITLIDASIRFGSDRKALNRFLIIALLMFALVYSFASSIVLYWAVSNLMSMFTFLRRGSHEPELIKSDQTRIDT
jgi:membrane protein insertase Oxa1/YidC/SpoIIIJ